MDPAWSGCFGRTKLEELLAIELAQPGRQGLLADKSQGEGGHGISGWAVGVSMYGLGRSRGCRTSVRTPSTGRKSAWMLGLRRKRTNLHEKYDYPNSSLATAAPSNTACLPRRSFVASDARRRGQACMPHTNPRPFGTQTTMDPFTRVLP